MKRPRIRAGGFYFSPGFAARSRALRARISQLRRSCARLDKTPMLRRLSICLNRGRGESVGNDDVSIVCARKYEMVDDVKTENPEGTAQVDFVTFIVQASHTSILFCVTQ